MTIDRFEYINGGHGPSKFFKSPDGSLVRYSDYSQLALENENLRAELKKLRSKRKKPLMCQSGDVYERLTIIGEASKRQGTKGRRVKWKCSCGNTGESFVTHIVRGNTKSCGCLLREAWRKIGKRER